MSDTSKSSLKSLNMKWLVLLVITDILLVVFFLAPELIHGITLTEVGVGRILSTGVAPIIVLLVINVLPHDIKAMLVYWKPLGVLPGSEAFTKHGPNDPRIDMAVLEKITGASPLDPKEQNSKWYKLYLQVRNETSVAEAHKAYLMYRDMTALSLGLVILAPLALYFAGSRSSILWLAAGVFLAQYVVTALSARWSGVRFVCNVLAIHSCRKIPAVKGRNRVTES